MKKEEGKIITIKDGYRHTRFINNSNKTLVELDKKEITSTNIERRLLEYNSTTFKDSKISLDELPIYVRQLVLDNGHGYQPI